MRHLQRASRFLRRMLDEALDPLERLMYRPRIIPPRRLRRSGKTIAGYVEGGARQLSWCVRLGRLTPDSDILDIGCGDGRLASALVPYIRNGSYSSFEVQKQFVDFLTGRITPSYPNFDFCHADLWHHYYNPFGRDLPEEYRFPHPNARFDVVFANSIFTHLTPPITAHYLKEIARVLRPGGTAVLTFFIANEEAIHYDSRGMSAPDLLLGRERLLNHHHGNYWSRDSDIHEHVLATDEEWLRNAIVDAGLSLEEIEWGAWCGRPVQENAIEQDLVVITRPTSFPDP